MKILIDNGHGISTKGKCSPDGRLREYKYCREIASRLYFVLKSEGYDAELLVPEDADISLAERCNRVNAHCDRLGNKKVLLVSIHLNAAGSDGKWHPASGWSGWVSKSASAQSKLLAQLLYCEAVKRGLKGNRCVPACKYWTADFKILSGTKCPAVLTENLFQDNEKEVEYLLTEEGKQAIVSLHADGIKEYLNELKS